MAGAGTLPSKTVADVLTSTSAITTHRLVLRAPARPLSHRYRWVNTGPVAPERRPWLERLRRALARDLFVLHYQPIVALADGRVSHYEALVRLADDPGGRLVAPGMFLPAAELHGVIRDIDRMVLGKVASLLGRTRGDGISVAMNLSALSVTDEGMLSQIERSLAAHGADPGKLVIELTETAAISDMRRASAFCAGVQSLGCAIALDDFGSGFGSFHYLKRLPFRFLKIDGDFIRGLPSSPTDQLVVKALVGVVSGMDRRTVAEFVEDEQTMTLLRSYGVDYAQGFQVGRPRPKLALGA